MKKIAVFTSGGDAPGMNACIRAAVRGAIYHGVEIMGIYRGYSGMINDEIMPLQSNSVSNILQRGGTILKSDRSDKFRTKEGREIAHRHLQNHGIEGLVCIGGNGTYAGALEFFNEYGIPSVGVPGTIDNDLWGTDQTIGFDTAVNTAIDAIDKIRDTADSHDRVFFVEVMGRDSGFIAINSGICAGAEYVCLPEHPDSIQAVIDRLKDDKRRKKTFSIIIVSEGDEIDVQTLSREVHNAIPSLKIRVTTLGHIQRGGAPSAVDRILASRLGLAAVEALLDGRQNVAVGIVNDELSYTPFAEAIGKRKDLNPHLLRLVKILSI